MVPERLFQPMEAKMRCQPRASWLACHRHAVDHVMYPHPTASAESDVVPNSQKVHHSGAEMENRMRGLCEREDQRRFISWRGGCVVEWTVVVSVATTLFVNGGLHCSWSPQREKNKGRTKEDKERRIRNLRCGSQLARPLLSISTRVPYILSLLSLPLPFAFPHYLAVPAHCRASLVNQWTSRNNSSLPPDITLSPPTVFRAVPLALPGASHWHQAQH